MQQFVRAIQDSAIVERAADIMQPIGPVCQSGHSRGQRPDECGCDRDIGPAMLFYVAELLAGRNARPARVGLAYAGFGAMLLGGYLGGHLAFSEQIGVCGLP
jgi:hypothetical protein